MAGGLGFEPRLMGPEPIVLPLDDPPTQHSSIYNYYNCVKSFYNPKVLDRIHGFGPA